MVRWHPVGGSQIPVRPMEELCSEGRSELMVLDGVGAGSPWDDLHPALDVSHLTCVWCGTGGSWLMEGCGARGGREGGSPAGQMNGAGFAGKAKLSKKPRAGHHRGKAR